MNLSDPQHWLSIRPLAEANQQAWIRAIQAEAIEYAIENFIRANVRTVQALNQEMGKQDPPTTKPE